MHFFVKILTDILLRPPVLAILAELEIAVSHWPFSNQFQDLADKNCWPNPEIGWKVTDMLGQICCTFPMGNVVHVTCMFQHFICMHDCYIHGTCM